MQVRRYVARTMTDAVAKVKADFGSNAVILQTRRVREPGLWGLLGRRRVEVLAALEGTARRRPASGAGGRAQAGQVPPAAAAPRSAVAPDRFDRTPAAPGLNQPVGRYPFAATPPGATGTGAPAISRAVSWSGWREPLIALGLPAADVEAVLEEASRLGPFGGAGALHPAAQRATLARLLAKRIATVEPWHLESRPTIHALVGPTGVGKTTTVAKLAANYALALQKKVGLVAADTYRLGAVEQLGQYADIIGAPLAVVRDGAELEAAVARMAHLDLILIDTMGTSQRDAERLRGLEALLAAVPRAERHLVVSATTRLPDMEQVVTNFGRLQPASVIVTKVDETTSPVAAFNAVRLSGRPLSFVTTGQSVPDDIESPDPAALAEAIVSQLNGPVDRSG